MNVLLVNFAARMPRSGTLLAALASALQEKGHTPLVKDEIEVAAVCTIIAAAENNSQAFRYSGAGLRDEPEIVVVAARALAHLPGMEHLTSDVPLAAFIVHEDAARTVPLYAPAGKLLPCQRLDAHLRLPHRSLDSHAELLWFLDVLCEFLLTVLGPAEFLRHHRWRPNLRLRKERFGGLVFIPETSQLIELDPDSFEAVAQSIAMNSHLPLVESSIPDIVATIAALSAGGALTTLSRESRE